MSICGKGIKAMLTYKEDYFFKHHPWDNEVAPPLHLSSKSWELLYWPDCLHSIDEECILSTKEGRNMNCTHVKLIKLNGLNAFAEKVTKRKGKIPHWTYHVGRKASLSLESRAIKTRSSFWHGVWWVWRLGPATHMHLKAIPLALMWRRGGTLCDS